MGYVLIWPRLISKRTNYESLDVSGGLIVVVGKRSCRGGPDANRIGWEKLSLLVGGLKSLMERVEQRAFARTFV